MSANQSPPPYSGSYTSPNLRTVLGYLDVVQANDLETTTEFLSEDFQHRFLPTGVNRPWRGKTQWISFLEESFAQTSEYESVKMCPLETIESVAENKIVIHLHSTVAMRSGLRIEGESMLIFYLLNGVDGDPRIKGISQFEDWLTSYASSARHLAEQRGTNSMVIDVVSAHKNLFGP